MKKRVLSILITWAAIALCASWAVAADTYNYIKAKDLNVRLSAGSPMIIVDICPVEQFTKGHVKGSIETNAYPVKTEEEKAKLAAILPKLKASADDIIVVCPKGGGGATKTVDYYKAGGIDEKRLLILEKGMGEWPYETEKRQ
ncbi:MAG: rhodanese-like domain-containing protein [Desulfobacula sp.]|nr:rhodanese-like domain-containing protein [Desulfobacula sp.]